MTTEKLNNYDVVYKTKSGRAMVAKNISAMNFSQIRLEFNPKATIPNPNTKIMNPTLSVRRKPIKPKKSKIWERKYNTRPDTNNPIRK